MKCKNTECENDVSNKRTYCSLRCRNIYVNRNLRDYSKCSNTFKSKRDNKEETYLLNPRNCLHCKSNIQYDKFCRDRHVKFCDHSCSASFHNQIIVKDDLWKSNISKGIKKYIKENPQHHVNKLCDIKSCSICGSDFITKNKFCSKTCYLISRRSYSDEGKSLNDKYRRYRKLSNFKFNLSDYPNEFDFSLIEIHGWYSPSNKKNNFNGVSRDHIFSVREGFEMDIDPNIISHPANCQLMVHNENISKNRRSDISYENLLKRIEDFNQKYSIPNLI